jgi:hypothetical protein
MHWFDRISLRAAEGEPAFNRRTAVKGAAAAAIAASPLASPLFARAASDLGAHLRESACQCQAEADSRATEQNKRLVEVFLTGQYVSGFGSVLVAAGLAGVLGGWVSSKLTCGKCVSSASGGLSGGGGSQCRAERGGCPPDGNPCAPGTTHCSDSLCCFGNDVCCGCGTYATCCIAEIGCTCCA